MRAAQNLAMALLAATLATVGNGVVAQEADASLDTCRQLQEKIARLDARRKGGGSVREMDQWKRQRQVFKDRFNALRCRHWGNRLR